MFELIAKAAYTEAMGASSAPEVLLFKRFKSQWHTIAQDRFEDCSTDPLVNSVTFSVKAPIVQFLQESLLKNHPRDDYRELIEITLIFLGHAPTRGIKFAKPGAMHQARWMSKIIYTFKTWMFRNQFRLTAREKNGLRDLCIFYALLYVRASCY